MNWIPSVIVAMFFSQAVSSSSMIVHEAWDPSLSAPEIMSYYFKKKFDQLPLQGTVAYGNKYWSGDYWPLYNGSINFRWYAKYKIGFNHFSPTKEMAKKMSIPELAELAPTEKYDLLTGRYHYPLRNKVSTIADPEAQIWEGICHGWSPATMNHNEPTPKLIKNPDGIEIPFGSTDIKALISYYYAHEYKAPDTQQMGQRCFINGTLKYDKSCENDLNAGSFHIVLTNRIGINKKGFIADLKRYKEVWNHPITGFSSRVLQEYGPAPDSAPGTSKIVFLQTTITYVDENGRDWQTVLGTTKQEFKTETYRYEIELNVEGDIIGGEWKSKNRPDFLWQMARPRKFEGILSRLQELLDD